MSLLNSIQPPPAGPLNQAGSSSWKRKGSDDENEDHESNVKKPRYSWYVTLESESPLGTDDSDTESMYSVQDQETEYARDTSDTSTTWISTSNDNANIAVEVEFELAASESESDNPYYDRISSSDPEDVSAVEVMLSRNSLSSSNFDYSEETDESIASVDSDFGRLYFYRCIQCREEKANPQFTHCEKCFQLKKNFFPPRPKRKRRKKNFDNKSNEESESSSAATTSNSQSLTHLDSGLGLSQTDSANGSQSQCDLANCSQGHYDSAIGSQSQSDSVIDSQQSLVSEVNNDNLTSSDSLFNVDNIDYNKASTSVSLDVCLPLSGGKNNCNEININDHIKKNDKSDDSDTKQCLVCTVKPKDGAFVHGKILHIFSCYTCAIQIWKRTKRCPICQRKVKNVSKLIFS
ncbi:E3 ubiquitin-protein ligase Mdm2-like [Microplitis mediator]|uniref:E3 ubiquitin-protein ligase Mdm2-like n=1 Tax=Microplitis mediator TaxID=375433 RepID=UPI0025578286|nr:E3 ubiquitin-protein ligase Mdm2-like [Microplitis mediator]